MLGIVGRIVRRQNPAGLTRVTRTAGSSFFSRSVSYAAEDVTLASSTEKENIAISATKPKPLSLNPNSPLRVTDPPPTGFSGVALKLLGFYTRESQLIRGSFALEKNFRTTHAMLLLHMWLTLVRLRAEGKDGSKVGQSLYEIFNHDLEKRVVGEGVKMLISKWMKELEKNFYGAVEAYDAAMQPTAVKDALARALWRNVFAEDDSLMPTGAAAAPVKSLARYVRREAACLALTDSESLLSGNILFSHDFDVTQGTRETDSTSLGQATSEPVPA
ncbi:hypothetical protein AXG93_2960s1310 [Marchantia polymorpha subsp. ruderalis]|uniref:Ubiquinol-cytochrome c chaperone domain-containing protein n=1 Tax=Marchantia polymorpha subsp. ruderalis TaxID=1480154 RepID=A0A176W976_MARPO|nr:hypothetical protein AXG93_2960s1310 [Marchantia polymorpha subsp. ruderalis]